MTSSTCQTLREALVATVSTGLGVTAIDGACVVTLPWETPDFRRVEVWVEPSPDHTDGRLLVHDCGKSLSQLWAQGIHPSADRAHYFRQLADRYRVDFADDTFSAVTRQVNVSDAVLRVAQVATLAMKNVLTHRPSQEQSPVSSLVRQGLVNATARIGGSIESGIQIAGRARRHKFDFIVNQLPSRSVEAVAVKILRPTYGSKIEAERYGFTVLDLQGLAAERWPRVAVVTRAEHWKKHDLQLVERLSGGVVEARSYETDGIMPQVADLIGKLATAA